VKTYGKNLAAFCILASLLGSMLPECSPIECADLASDIVNSARMRGVWRIAFGWRGTSTARACLAVLDELDAAETRAAA
jgi:hypothetical protein